MDQGSTVRSYKGFMFWGFGLRAFEGFGIACFEISSLRR